MNFDRKALKQMARTAVRETRPKAWLVTMVFMLLAVALPSLVTGVLNPMRELLPQVFEDLARMTRRGVEPDEIWALELMGQYVRDGGGMVLFISVLISLFTVVLDYGYRDYTLRIYRKQNAQVDALFSAFPAAGRAIGTEIVTLVFTVLWVLLCNLVFGLAGWLLANLLGLEVLSAIFTVLAALAGAVLAGLRYCLAPYFILTDPNMSAMDALRASKSAMRGNYREKFTLDLSFLGWQILVALVLYAIAILGAIMVLLTVSGDWIAALKQQSNWNEILTENASRETMGQIFSVTSELLRSIMLPMTLVGMLAWLAALPLNLWLQAYMGVTNAGFFLFVTGKTAPERPDAEAPAQPPVPPTPPVERRMDAPEITGTEELGDDV